jgi:pimeloyl-ACP methyl ester carboxylesterase
MVRIVFFFTVLILFLVPGVRSQQIDYKGFPQWSWHREGNTEYYLYSPDGINPGQKCPLAIFLHGCCGEDDHATLRNAVDPPVRMWHHFGANIQQEPTYIMAPKTTRGWSQKFPDIRKVIDEMVSSGKVDPQRIYMTGFSMGGAGTWQFMEQYPGLIAAAIPMGSGIRADLEKIKDTPSWAIRGEYDYFAQKLDSQVAVVRKLNGDPRGGLEWVTGVNPLFTSFEGLGHGIQWDAVSSLDLLDWVYDQVNDGNIKPVIYFTYPVHKETFFMGEKVGIELNGNDPDGKIKKVILRLNGDPVKVSKKVPLKAVIAVAEGDNILEAIARDDRGKINVAKLIIRTDVLPVISTERLPEGEVGVYYIDTVLATGNEPLIFFPEKMDLPAGLRMKGNQILGIPEKEGEYMISVSAIDDDGQKTTRDFMMIIKGKPQDKVLVTRVRSIADSLVNRVSVMRVGELPNEQAGTEVSFSEVGEFEGLTYISTSQDQANMAGNDILSFDADEDVMVYVAYEKMDNLFESTIPEWLKEYERVDKGQIVAQYHYFDVYGKSFPRGRISIPGADAGRNNIIRNYFVMIEKDGK